MDTIERACETCRYEHRDDNDCWYCLSDSHINPLRQWRPKPELVFTFMKEEVVPLLDQDFDYLGDLPTLNVEDPVNSPKHYQLFPDGTEAIDIIRTALTPEEFAGYCKGNFLKYRLRAGAKDDLEQDINKSNKYVEFMNAR